MNANDMIYDELMEGHFEAQPVRRKSTSNGTSAFKSSGGNRKAFGRRGSSPKQFNGIHRRRTKKIRW